MKKFRKLLTTVTLVTSLLATSITANATILNSPSTDPTAIIYKSNDDSYKNEWKKYTESATNSSNYSGWTYWCYHESIDSNGKKRGKTYGSLDNTWAKISGKWYYFTNHGYYYESTGSDSRMAANEWIDGYWFNKNGTWTYKYRASWKHNKTGWWYGDASGWYAKGWQRIDNNWYYFNNKGYAVSGWQKIGGKWYYFYTGKESDVNAIKKKGKSFAYERPTYSMANDGFVQITAPTNKLITTTYFFKNGSYS